MSDNSIQFIKSTDTAPVNGLQRTLYEGSSVFVRVLKKDDNGIYTVSFSGRRFLVRSEKDLVAGQTFRASVNVENGIIKLVPQLEVQYQNTENSTLLQMLAMQGFVPDGITEKLLQYMQQSGLKIDSTIMDKARLIALQFPGKEKKAAEIAAILLSRGIDPDYSAVLSLMEADGKNNKNYFNQPEEKESCTKDRNAGCFLDKIYCNAEDILKNHTAGTLILVNQIKEGDKHWIILPFEWSAGGKNASGMIRLLLDTVNKQIKKMQIQCDFPLKSYNFVLLYKNSKVKEIRFCTLPPLLTRNISLEEKRLGELFSSGMNNNISVPVTYSASALVDGFCADSEDLLLFDKKI